MISPDPMTSEAYAETQTRFSHFAIVDASGEAERTRRAELAADAACVLLGSSQFNNRPVSAKIEIITGICNNLMSRPTPDLPVVAELGLRRFHAMLDAPDLTEADLCKVYDALHGMYFAGIVDVRDLRRFDAIVPAVERWLQSRLGERPTFPSPRLPPALLTVAYLIHVGHLERGNAVTPLVMSLARMHAQRANRRIIVYLVEYIEEGFAERFREFGIETRSFPQYGRYDRIDALARSIRADDVDVVVTEQNRSIATALFVRRVAPLQIWLDTGFPFWSLTALDWSIAPARPADSDGARVSHITWRQTAETLKRNVDPAEVAAVRNGLPPGFFILGVFARLIKLDKAYLAFVGRLLASNPLFHLLIAGPGESALIDAFRRDPRHAERVTFVPGNVDLNAYGAAIDVMCDTFPFVGGNACREVTAHGTPVVSKLGTPWDGLLRSDRSPDLLAADEDAYIELVNRLFSDRSFLRRQRQAAFDLAAGYVDPMKMIDDVEHAIAAASADRSACGMASGKPQ